MKIAVAQLNYVVMNFEFNFNKIFNVLYKFKDADLIIFSELCITGYYPYDFLFYPDAIDKQNQVINKIKNLTLLLGLTVVIGVVKEIPKIKKFYNSALVISFGKVVFNYNKQLIPNYGIFNEARHFVSGNNSPIFTLNNKKIALLICEDIWYKKELGYLLNPLDQLPDQGLDLIITINASPSVMGKIERRTALVRSLAIKKSSPVVYCSQVGGYDNIVYDGSSFVCNCYGQLIKAAKSFQEDIILIDLPIVIRKDSIVKKFFQVSDNPFSFIFNQIILGLRDYVRKCGSKMVVIGCSGGVDSAVSIALAVIALEKENVIAITMPGPYSSQASIDDSIELCKRLRNRIFIHDINEEFSLACKNFENTFGIKPNQRTQENIQARIRGRVTMEYSNHFGSLVLTTGNKSELAVGYTTIYGDMCGALNCIGDLYKTDVYELAHYINRQYEMLIPEQILSKPPSAELSSNQKDCDSLPDYYLLDAVLKLYLDQDTLTESEILFLKKTTSRLDQDEKNKIHALIESSEFKRKQSPQILVISSKHLIFNRNVPISSGILLSQDLVEVVGIEPTSKKL